LIRACVAKALASLVPSSKTIGGLQAFHPLDLSIPCLDSLVVDFGCTWNESFMWECPQINFAINDATATMD